MKITDGWLKINTRLNNENLKQDLKDAKSKLNKFKNEEEKLNNKKIKIEADLKVNEESYKKQIDELAKKYQKEIKEATSFDGKINAKKMSSITQKYEPQLEKINKKSDYVKASNELNVIATQLERNKAKQEEWNTKVEELNDKLKDVEAHNESEKNINKINKSIKQTIKRVGSLVIAIFGLRTAYSAVRNAANILSQYNKQIGTDMEYIKYALATAFQPIIEKIISLVYKLLSLINSIAKSWFNIDLFGKASIKNFNSVNNSAKKLQKTLAGFDEINQLSDNSAENKGTPSVDLSKSANEIKEIQMPKWFETIKKNWQPILFGLLSILGVIALISKSKLGKVGTSFTGFFDGLGKATSAIAILGGLTLVIKSITDLIDTFSKSGLELSDVAKLLGIVLGEVAGSFIVLMGAMALLNPSWQSIAGAVVIFAGLALVLTSVSQLIDVFANSGLSLNDVIGLMSTILLTIIGLMGSIVLLGPAMTAGLGPFLVVVGAISAILLVMAATLPIILESLGDFISKSGPVIVEILRTIGDLITSIIYALGTSLPPIINSVGSLFDKIFGGISKVVNTVGNSIVKILDSVGRLVNSVLGSLLGFINGLGPAIENFVDHAISAITKLINFMISGMEYLINTLVIDGVNAIIKGINSIGKYVGFTIDPLGKFKIPRFKPTYMATGGIIDVPKRGVSLGNSIVGGEAGAEGVLPLTNESTMQRLGQEIGKWITLNLSLTNEIDGHVLNRILKEIQGENAFARNGGTL